MPDAIRHLLLAAAFILVADLFALIVLLACTHARAYRSDFSYEWSIRRRPGGYVEINLGSWVITTEPE